MIVDTITDKYALYNYLQKSDNYKNKLSLEGAVALQQYFEDYSEELGENIEFDPIAWICEFTEYKDLDEYNKDNGTEYTEHELLDNHAVVGFEGGMLVGVY